MRDRKEMEPNGKGVGEDLGVAEEEKINQYIYVCVCF